MEPVTLVTERLSLRPFEPTDVDDVYAYARDPEWGRFLPLPSPYEYEHAVEYVEGSMNASWTTTPVFAICLNGRVVGSTSIRVDARNRTAGLGYAIAREHWGKGLVAEAVEAVIDWAFETFDLAKVTAMADIKNTRSWRVMEKLGMRRDGVLRSELQSDADPGSRQDMVVYSVLREEWQAPPAE